MSQHCAIFVIAAMAHGACALWGVMPCLADRDQLISRLAVAGDGLRRALWPILCRVPRHRWASRGRPTAE